VPLNVNIFKAARKAITGIIHTYTRTPAVIKLSLLLSSLLLILILMNVSQSINSRVEFQP